MTTEEAKNILHTPDRSVALAVLSYVNLTDREAELLMLRHLHGLTQDQVAGYFDVESRTIQRWESEALGKCAVVWDNNPFVKWMLKLA